MVTKFLDYVEIKTKITSVFAFLFTIGFLMYQNYSIRWELTIIFFLAMFIFDLATTAINNYIDTKDNHEQLQFERKTALKIIYILIGISGVMGLYLAYKTDIVLLIIGAICFLCGIFYTYGPIPISRQPLGEILSGIFYGVFIPFLIMYINMPKDTFLVLEYSLETVGIQAHIKPFVQLFLLSTVPFATTANIMLANNTCDLEKDILVKRYTLPYYIGQKSLYLFAALYATTYITTIIMVVLNILPYISLLTLVTIPMVWKNINTFFQLQDKDSTFIVAIKNYLIIMVSHTVLIFISILLRQLGG